MLAQTALHEHLLSWLDAYEAEPEEYVVPRPMSREDSAVLPLIEQASEMPALSASRVAPNAAGAAAGPQAGGELVAMAQNRLMRLGEEIVGEEEEDDEPDEDDEEEDEEEPTDVTAASEGGEAAQSISISSGSTALQGADGHNTSNFSRRAEPGLVSVPVRGLLNYMKAVAEGEGNQRHDGASADATLCHCQLEDQQDVDQTCFESAAMAAASAAGPAVVAGCSCCSCTSAAAEQEAADGKDISALRPGYSDSAMMSSGGCASAGVDSGCGCCHDVAAAAEAGRGDPLRSCRAAAAAGTRTVRKGNRSRAAEGAARSSAQPGVHNYVSSSRIGEASAAAAAAAADNQVAAAVAVAAAVEEEATTCGVCMDEGCTVLLTPCRHQLCVGCCRKLVESCRKPTSCPFCRQHIGGFKAIASG